MTLDLKHIRACSGDSPVCHLSSGPHVRDLCNEIERLRAIVDKLLVSGNSLLTYGLPPHDASGAVVWQEAVRMFIEAAKENADGGLQ